MKIPEQKLELITTVDALNKRSGYSLFLYSILSSITQLLTAVTTSTARRVLALN